MRIFTIIDQRKGRNESPFSLAVCKIESPEVLTELTLALYVINMRAILLKSTRSEISRENKNIFIRKIALTQFDSKQSRNLLLKMAKCNGVNPCFRSLGSISAP